jgi:hypothetical protein
MGRAGTVGTGDSYFDAGFFGGSRIANISALRRF